MILRVDTAARLLMADGQAVPCAIGRAGARPADAKREGDGATPLGRWPIRGALLRPDRVAAGPLRLPWRWMRPDDGWSDDPADPAYNRPVRHPHAFAAERLWREDGLYDIVVALAHNDDPPLAGRGSAIFLHCWREAMPTEGCVAVAVEALTALLPKLGAGDMLAIG